MRGPGERRWPLLRASVFTLVAVCVAAAGHVVGGGGSPDLFTVSVAYVVTAAPAGFLARRDRGFASIAASLSVIQVLLHAVFMTGERAHGVLMIGPGMAGMHSSSGGSVMTAAMGPGVWGSSPTAMLAGHGLAVVLSALLMARGERVLRALWHLVWPSTPRPVLLGFVWAVPRPLVSVGARPGWALDHVRRRGPPWTGRTA
jgi:hypothetical protein